MKIQIQILIGVFLQIVLKGNLVMAYESVIEEPINLLSVGLTRPWTYNVLRESLVKHHHLVEVKAPLNVKEKNEVTEEFMSFEQFKSMHSFNPFYLFTRDFFVGDYLPWPTYAKRGEIPNFPQTSIDWFLSELKANRNPNVFFIGGHHVISEGYHNQAETSFLYEQSLFKLVEQNPDVKKYFSKVKLAVLWGCNTLTNLEPHLYNGELLSQAQIKNLYFSGPEGRRQVIGEASYVNTMEMYKTRLAREYGPGTHEYAYTRNPELEKCAGPGKWENCDIANLDRIMPEHGLFDESRRYNEALKASELFPNAYLVLGFSSASPSEELRVKIFSQAIADADDELNLSADKNVIDVIVSDNTPLYYRKQAIDSLRKHWENRTFLMNRGRPSGSITPAFHDIDQGYVLFQHRIDSFHLYGKYH